MKSLIDYIELAKEKSNLTSDRALSLEIGISNSNICSWRKGHTVPKEKQLLKLAELAGISKEQAVIEWSFWKADIETKPVYENILKRIASWILPATLFGSILIESGTANASEIQALSSSYAPILTPIVIGAICIKICKYNVYYGK